MLVNACYADAPVGTGTWTRAIMAAMPNWEFTIPSGQLYRRERGAFYRKLAYELLFPLRSIGARLYPYLPWTIDPMGYVVVLDTIGENRRANWHRVGTHAAVRSCIGLASISRAEAQEVQSLFDRSCAVLTPFPDREFFAPTLECSPRGYRRRVNAVYWGGPDPRKRIRETAAALKGSVVDLTVVGAVVQDAARCLPALPRRDLVRLIDSADVVIYPSAREGYGLPVHEALLRDKPVVCRKLPAYEDIVSSPEALYFMEDVSNPRSLVELVLDAAHGAMRPRDTLRTPERGRAIMVLRQQLADWVSHGG